MSASLIDQVTSVRATTHSSAELSAFQEQMSKQDAASQEMKKYETKLILTLLNANRSAEKLKDKNSLDQRNQNGRASGGLSGS